MRPLNSTEEKQGFKTICKVINNNYPDDDHADHYKEMADGKDDDMYICMQVNPIDGTIKVEMPQKDQLESPAKVSTHPTIYVTFPVEIVRYYCG